MVTREIIGVRGFRHWLIGRRLNSLQYIYIIIYITEVLAFSASCAVRIGATGLRFEELEDVRDRRFCDPKYVTSFLSNLANAGLIELAANAVTSLLKASLQAGKQRIHRFQVTTGFPQQLLVQENQESKSRASTPNIEQ